MERLRRIFVISDTHFYHTNIIKYCNRPFTNIEEMNAQLIKNWNNVVNPADIVIHCGDFAFTPANKEAAIQRLTGIIKQLSGHIILIKGNHDHTKVKYVELPNIDYECYQPLVLNDCRFIHSPYVMKKSDFNPYRFTVNGKVYFGHTHNKADPDLIYTDNAMCVCAEFLDYTPREITFELSQQDYEKLCLLAPLTR